VALLKSADNVTDDATAGQAFSGPGQRLASKVGRSRPNNACFYCFIAAL